MITIFAVREVVGTLLQVNVNLPAACKEHFTPALTHASSDVVAGAQMIVSFTATPLTLTVCELLDHPDALRVAVVLMTFFCFSSRAALIILF